MITIEKKPITEVQRKVSIVAENINYDNKIVFFTYKDSLFKNDVLIAKEKYAILQLKGADFDKYINMDIADRKVKKAAMLEAL